MKMELTRIYLFLFVGGMITVICCGGCISTVRWFVHSPTDKYIYSTDKFVQKNDFKKLSDFVVEGVLFIPAFKTLRESHPSPHAGVVLISKEKKIYYLNKAVLQSDSGDKVAETIGEKTVSIDHTIKNDLFCSPVVELFTTKNLNLKDVLDNNKILHLEIYFSKLPSAPKLDQQSLSFRLKRVNRLFLAYGT